MKTRGGGKRGKGRSNREGLSSSDATFQSGEGSPCGYRSLRGSPSPRRSGSTLFRASGSTQPRSRGSIHHLASTLKQSPEAVQPEASNQSPAAVQREASNPLLQEASNPPPRVFVSHHSSQAQNSHAEEDEDEEAEFEADFERESTIPEDLLATLYELLAQPSREKYTTVISPKLSLKLYGLVTKMDSYQKRWDVVDTKMQEIHEAYLYDKEAKLVPLENDEGSDGTSRRLELSQEDDDEIFLQFEEVNRKIEEQATLQAHRKAEELRVKVEQADIKRVANKQQTEIKHLRMVKKYLTETNPMFLEFLESAGLCFRRSN
ncbi:hypothetical protein AXX17_AT4G07440 [Arabidopsis thaliana]|uniref:Uncharacterized protein n=1 Tax=Arabidopsis thaliana TaxID=3702 RepID=A0A178V348_ARATH|nr:hypothetical protein AXX17_AT4G07440 [Arabidopsis thaliana]